MQLETPFDSPMTRRRALEVLAGSAALTAFSPRLFSEEKRARKVLFFTKSSGFEHPVVKREGEKLGLAETVFTAIGKKHGFEVLVTKDGGIFDKDLGAFDVIFFYTSGNLLEAGTDKQPPMSAHGKEALLAAVKAGKGFMGSHCANDTFHSAGGRFETQASPDAYIAMLGGEFIRHGAQQKARVRVVDPKFPGQKSAGDSFEIQEEWYSNKNFAPDLHVIHVLETKGMDGLDYERPPFPLTWTRMHGKGRVFYTSLGHRDDVWTSDRFQEMLAGAVGWCAGDADADVKPNMKEAAPEHGVVPPEKKKA